MKKQMKRIIALLLALCLLLGCTALAEEDEEEISLDDLMQSVGMTEDDDLLIEDEEELFIGEDIQEELSLLDQDMELDETVSVADLELNPNLPENVINILLIGIDTREGTVTSETRNSVRGDVQMILSVNTEDGSVKLSSILRDSYVTIPGYKNKNKINAAYGRGGGELAMRTINHNFAMNIQYYATINFYGLASIIDAIGGIDVDMTRVEAGAINTYLRKHPPAYDNTDGSERVPLEKKAGVQHLDGVQAVMYARLREIDNDFARTARQRHLMELLLGKVMQDMDMNKLMTLINTALPFVTTNVNASTIFNLALGVLKSDIISRARSGGELLGQFRIPMDKSYSYKNINGASVVNMSDSSLKRNTQALHEFIYGAYYPAK